MAKQPPSPTIETLAASGKGRFRNRVVEMRLMTAGELLDHEGNWRVHPLFQLDATEGSLDEIGKAGALRAYFSARNDGRLTLVDGHARKSLGADEVWPVLILDLDDDEADKLLAMDNAIGAWAQTDALKLQALIEKAKIHNEKAQEAANRIKARIEPQVELARRLSGTADAGKPQRLVQDAEAKRKLQVRVVIAIEDDLATVEQAIKAVGVKNRGAALVEICRFYLANWDEEDGSQED